MENLNYCRQIQIYLSDFLQKHRHSMSETGIELYESYLEMALKAVKFILPEGGRLHDDGEFKALDETEPLHLPFKTIALEYSTGSIPADGSFDRATKKVIFAHEAEVTIVVGIAFFSENYKEWLFQPFVALEKQGYLDRTNVVDGRVAIIFRKTMVAIPDSDYGDELGALLAFLNVLQCSNVDISPSPKNRPKTKKIKTAVPFDDYHILTIRQPTTKAGEGKSAGIGGLHSSPREHLRRGHIRRLSDSRRVWVNATVVNAGVGPAVQKDYRLK